MPCVSVVRAREMLIMASVPSKSKTCGRIRLKSRSLIYDMLFARDEALVGGGGGQLRRHSAAGHRHDQHRHRHAATSPSYMSSARLWPFDCHSHFGHSAMKINKIGGFIFILSLSSVVLFYCFTVKMQLDIMADATRRLTCPSARR